jgi:hypothetical protein
MFELTFVAMVLKSKGSTIKFSFAVALFGSRFSAATHNQLTIALVRRTKLPLMPAISCAQNSSSVGTTMCSIICGWSKQNRTSPSLQLTFLKPLFYRFLETALSMVHPAQAAIGFAVLGVNPDSILTVSYCLCKLADL